MFFQLVPVFGDHGEVQLYDIFKVQDEKTEKDIWEWHGSRRTREQCQRYIRHVCKVN